MDVAKIKEMAKQIRLDSIRITTNAGSGHPGGSLSAADIFASLYFGVMRYDAKDPRKKDRDRFVLSAGHICPGLYAAMAHAGFFPHSELDTLRQFPSRLQGHPSRLALPGIETSTGSLGQGISVALGMALGLRLDRSPARVYCLMGDGEQNEGEVWEAAQAAAHFKLGNLCGIVDWNGVQQDGSIEAVMGIEPLEEKYRSFGWNTIAVDGHDVQELLDAFSMAAAKHDAPTVILAKTSMGHGVSFMEGKYEYHGKALKPEEAKKASAELSNG